MRAEWKEIVLEFAADVGILPSATLENYHVVSEKILGADQHVGGQPPHLDADLATEELETRFSVILYCTDFVESTAVPLFSKSEFALPAYGGPSKKNPKEWSLTDESVAAMKKTVEAGLFERSAYHTIKVRAGDMMIFAHSTPHFGTENPVMNGRIALFSILSPSVKKGQDDFQVYPWQYVERCFGRKSKELAEALYLEREHHPMDHCLDRGTKADYMAVLLRWRYITLDVAALSYADLAYRRARYLPECEHGRWLTDAEFKNAMNGY